MFYKETSNIRENARNDMKLINDFLNHSDLEIKVN